MKHKEQNLMELIVNQSLGEAHLYVAVAKADGKVSKNEYLLTGFHAQQSQENYDIFKINKKLAERIKGDTHHLLHDPSFKGWSADQHLDAAILHLKKARDLGNWTVSFVALKHEERLLDVALLDNYVYTESQFVKKVVARLQSEFNSAEGGSPPVNR